MKRLRKEKESEPLSPDSFGLTDFILSTFGIAMHKTIRKKYELVKKYYRICIIIYDILNLKFLKEGCAVKDLLKELELHCNAQILENIARALHSAYQPFLLDVQIWQIIEKVFPENLLEIVRPYKKLCWVTI